MAKIVSDSDVNKRKRKLIYINTSSFGLLNGSLSSRSFRAFFWNITVVVDSRFKVHFIDLVLDNLCDVIQIFFDSIL